jgi:O-antigen ligase
MVSSHMLFITSTLQGAAMVAAVAAVVAAVAAAAAAMAVAMAVATAVAAVVAAGAVAAAAAAAAKVAQTCVKRQQWAAAQYLTQQASLRMRRQIWEARPHETACN